MTIQPGAADAAGSIDETTGPAVLRVLLVDDHPIMRAGARAVLSALKQVRVVGEAGTAEEALRQIELVGPDVVFLDLRLPGMGGVEACAQITERHPGVRTIILTQFSNQAVLARAFSAGARGFVVKDADPTFMRQALEVVASGRVFVDPKVARRLVLMAAEGRRATGPYGLSMAEMRVLELLPRGLSNAEIALELGLSIDTVKSHVKKILRKLDVRDRAHAAVIAVQEGLG